MNGKRLFGSLLTLLGITSFIYTAKLFHTATEKDIKTLIVCGVVGMFFFISGINLVRTTKDAS